MVWHSYSEVKLQPELEGTRVVRRSGLPGGADGRTCRGIADGIHSADVEAIQHVESIGDHLKIEALSDVDLLGDSQVDLEETWLVKRIAAKIPSATRGRHWNRGAEWNLRAIAAEAIRRNDELGLVDEGRNGRVRKASGNCCSCRQHGRTSRG